MRLQPDHHDVLTALLNLCNNAVMECEAELEQQRVSDMAEAKRLEEERKVRENEARMLAEQQEKERREKTEKMEKDRLEIEAVERDLAARKEALRNSQKGSDKEDGEEEEGSESGAEEQPVSVSVNMVAILYTYSDQQFCQDTSKTKTKRELEEEGRKKAPQTTHGVVSVPL